MARVPVADCNYPLFSLLTCRALQLLDFNAFGRLIKGFITLSLPHSFFIDKLVGTTLASRSLCLNTTLHVAWRLVLQLCEKRRPPVAHKTFIQFHRKLMSRRFRDIRPLEKNLQRFHCRSVAHLYLGWCFGCRVWGSNLFTPLLCSGWYAVDLLVGGGR